MPFDKLESEVIDSGLCCSCGTCVSACPLGYPAITLGEVGSVKKPGTEGCPDNCFICFEACPGRNLPFSEMEQMIFGRRRRDDPNEQMFGIYKNHMVTHAVDDQIHETGVAGASVSALLIHGLETGFLDAAIVAGYDKEKPWQVRPFLVSDRECVLAGARSKYGVCSTNTLLAEAAKNYERIGMVACPCHVWGVRKLALRKLAPKITDRIKVVIGLYCLAQNFSLAAEYMITERMGVNLEDVAEFQYRGGGLFGGGTWVKTKDGQEKTMELLGNWGMVPTVFIGYQMERCFVCLDHVAELADLSAGDVWGRHHELEKKSNLGWTGIFVRTPVGQEIMESATRAGALYAEQDDTISEYYCVNPGHSKKRFANPKRIEYRRRYGWPVPNIT
ncbi:MAG: Coenzyme F420 hydrogenase/dehydrogenase, beta subunit C-terminal domain [Desulfatiglandaceae bacterium]